MQVCVLGAGSLGTLIGGLLARAHEVTLVGRQPHVDQINSEGVAITGEISETVYPAGRTDLPESTELVVVTVKSFDTAKAAEQLQDYQLAGVLSLQNGMGNEAVLANYLDTPVLAGTCTYGARLAEPGTVECTGTGEIILGPAEGGRSAFADDVGAAFERAGLMTTVSAEMKTKRWEKLAINSGINATTALARVENGALVDGPASAVAARAARETAQVARTQGVGLDGDSAAEQTLAVADATAANTSSMHQDLRSGSRTEIDAINGYVVDHATQPVPVNQTLTALIRGWERERGLRE